MSQVPGWSDDELEARAAELAALVRKAWRAVAMMLASQLSGKPIITAADAGEVSPMWQSVVEDQIVGFITDTYIDAAVHIAQGAGALPGDIVGDDLVEVFINESRNRLKGIGDDVWQVVKEQIQQGINSGDDLGEIAARVKNTTGVSDGRAMTIARTEVHAAHEAGSYDQALYVDPNGTKTWLATEDERTRPTHVAADGQTVPIDGEFSVGGSSLRYPGDPLGEAGEVINCRCSTAYEFADIEDAEVPVEGQSVTASTMDETYGIIDTVPSDEEMKFTKNGIPWQFTHDPTMTAAADDDWDSAKHPRGKDGKFIKKGGLVDFLKQKKETIPTLMAAMQQLDAEQWANLTSEQKAKISNGIGKLPNGSSLKNELDEKLLDIQFNAPSTKKTQAKKAVPAKKASSPAKPSWAKSVEEIDIESATPKDAVDWVSYFLPEDSDQLTSEQQSKFKSLVQQAVDENIHGSLFAQKQIETWKAHKSSGKKLTPLDVKLKFKQFDKISVPEMATAVTYKMDQEYWDGLTTEQQKSISNKTLAAYAQEHASSIDAYAKLVKFKQNAAAKTVSTPASTPDMPETHNTTPTPSVVSTPVPAALDKPTTIAGLKGKPGDPAKVTTGVIWGKHKPDTTILEDSAGNTRIVWDGKKYQAQAKLDGKWATASTWTKKDAYAKLKNDTHWVVPGATPQITQQSAGEPDFVPFAAPPAPAVQLEEPTASIPDNALTTAQAWNKLFGQLNINTPVGAAIAQDTAGKYTIVTSATVGIVHLKDSDGIVPGYKHINLNDIKSGLLNKFGTWVPTPDFDSSAPAAQSGAPSPAAMKKFQEQFNKGLLTHDEFYDVTGMYPIEFIPAPATPDPNPSSDWEFSTTVPETTPGDNLTLSFLSGLTKHNKLYGTVIAYGPDGQKIAWDSETDSYVKFSDDITYGTPLTQLKAIQTIRTKGAGWGVPKSFVTGPENYLISPSSSSNDESVVENWHGLLSGYYKPGDVVATSTSFVSGVKRRVIAGMSPGVYVIQVKGEDGTWINDFTGYADDVALSLDTHFDHFTWKVPPLGTNAPSTPNAPNVTHIAPHTSINEVDKDFFLGEAQSGEITPPEAIILAKALSSDDFTTLSLKQKTEISDKLTTAVGAGGYYGSGAHEANNHWLKLSGDSSEVTPAVGEIPAWMSGDDEPDSSSVTTTPITPSVSTPTPVPVSTAPTLTVADIPASTIASWKQILKTDKVGYWSKPAAIWDKIQEIQALYQDPANPGQPKYSPLLILQALDAKLKTQKPNPFETKMTAWAKTATGDAYIKNHNGTTLNPTLSVSVTTGTPATANTVWDAFQVAKVGDVIATGTHSGGKKYQIKKTGTVMPYLQIQVEDASENDGWYELQAVHDQSSLAALFNTYTNDTNVTWDPTKPAAAPAPITPATATAMGTDDISHLSEAHKQKLYDDFKKQPNTYLSDQPKTLWVALKQISSNNGLTMAQTLGVIDDIGAKKVSKPNAFLFTKKIKDWLQTPKGAAIASGVPLPKPPTPKFTAGVSLSNVMSFEESSKLSYNIISRNQADKIWPEIMSKHGTPWTASQKAGLTAYTGGIFYAINSYLWGESDTVSPSNEKAMTQSQLGMRPSDRPLLLHRGTGFVGIGATSHADLLTKIGTTWRSDGFNSSSIGGKAAFGHSPAIVEIEAPPGTPMAWVNPISHYKDKEDEMLLAAGLHYKILSVKKDTHGKTIVRVRVVPAPEETA